MWFGFSFHGMAFILVTELKKRFNLLIASFNLRIDFEIIVPKMNKTFSKITIILFWSLMLNQIITVITIYYYFEIVARFIIMQIMQMPNIMLIKRPIMTKIILKELIGIFLKMSQYMKELMKNITKSLIMNLENLLILINRLLPRKLKKLSNCQKTQLCIFKS
jgi:hypothetical protein